MTDLRRDTTVLFVNLRPTACQVYTPPTRTEYLPCTSRYHKVTLITSKFTAVSNRDQTQLHDDKTQLMAPCLHVSTSYNSLNTRCILQSQSITSTLQFYYCHYGWLGSRLLASASW